MSLPDKGGWQHALVEHETAIRALDGALETVTAERDSLRVENERLQKLAEDRDDVIFEIREALDNDDAFRARALITAYDQALCNLAGASDEQEATNA